MNRIKSTNQVIIMNQIIVSMITKTKNSKRENAYATRYTYSKSVSTSSAQQENPNEKKTSNNSMKQDKEF